MDFSHEKDGLNMQRSWLHTVWIRGIRSERFRFDQHFLWKSGLSRSREMKNQRTLNGKTTMWMNNSNQPCLNNGFDPTFRWDFRLKEDILIRFFKKTAI